MKSKYLIVILPLIIIFLISCNNNTNEPPYVRTSDRIVDQYIKDMKKRYSLYCFGRGGMLMDRVNEIDVSFNCIGPKDIVELRGLLVSAIEELLKRFNENEEIRPFLKDYPFTAKNCCVSVYLTDEEGREIRNSGNGKEFLRSIYQQEGIVIYRIKNDEKVASQEVYRETYEDALNIARNQITK